MSFRKKRQIEDNKPTRYYSSIQEESIAKKVNGTKVKNSGATRWHKGDVVTDNWLIEAKTCVKDRQSFTIQKEWFSKNLDESLFMSRRHSAVAFNFGPNSKNYYIIDEQTFLLIKDLLDKES